jgi:hypothetical protein
LTGNRSKKTAHVMKTSQHACTRITRKLNWYEPKLFPRLHVVTDARCPRPSSSQKRMT